MYQIFLSIQEKAGYRNLLRGIFMSVFTRERQMPHWNNL